MAELFWLSDGQWASIEPLLPHLGGKPRVDDRGVISGILHRFREGLRWRALPDEYGPRTTLFNRFNRWSERGLWQELYAALVSCGEPPLLAMVDSTAVRAHRSAAGAKGGSKIRQSAARVVGAPPKSTRSATLYCLAPPLTLVPTRVPRSSSTGADRSDTLPDDPDLLQQMLRTMLHQQSELHAENDKLRLLIQRLTRHQFGRRSEQLTDEQLQFGLEDLEQTIAENQAGQEAAVVPPAKPRGQRAARNHGALPAHLPRYEVVIDAAPGACPCCSGTMHRIGELRTEQLDIVPAQLRVRVTRRPRYACRSCEETVVVAEAPARPIDGGMPTEALITHVLISKFCDSLPLYRQSQMLARQGIALDRSTLSNWVGTACWWLAPLYDLVVSTVLSSGKVFADDTTLPVLDPGRGRTKTGRLWCYAVDDRPWCGPSHPAAAYVYSEDRKGIRPAGHLVSFQGVLQVDGYAGFKRLAGDRADTSVQLAFCWVHMRRAFYQFHASTGSPIAAELLARVASLYAIEADIRGHPAEHRRQVRCARSRPIVEALHDWLHDQLPRVSGASDLAKAMRYAIRHWPGLVAFLGDGRIEMDTNTVERVIRPITLTRKNALFAGSEGGARHWAIAMTLIQTAKLNGVEPMAWLTDVLERVVSGSTKSNELETLLPWKYYTYSVGRITKLAA